MKTCPRCKKKLLENAFRRNRNRKDGLDGWCKECRSQTVNKEKARINRIKFQEKCKADYWKKYRQKHWVKVHAREIAQYYYSKRMLCCVLGCDKIAERHHHDYLKPLDIFWLCKKHHSLLHRS